MYFRSFILRPIVGLCVFSFFVSCDTRQNEQVIPEIFSKYITQKSTRVPYKQLILSTGAEKEKAPDSISSNAALEDVEMLEYLWKSSYSGYEYWEFHGADFDGYIENLKSWVSQVPMISTLEFENQTTSILKEIYDGHISFVGAGYYGAYRHKSVYFSDVLVEKTDTGEYRVIDSKNNMVTVGATFTQDGQVDYLFPTLAPPGKQQFLVGVFSYTPQRSIEFSFDHEIREVTLHKSRLMLAKFDDPAPYYINRENVVPVVRVTGFGDALYTQMQDFMLSGFELKNEKTILINLFNNGGGSSVYPQTFLKNLNGSVQWDVHWAELTSPAIAEYYANFKLDPQASPGLKKLANRYSGQFEKLRSFPTKSWTFSRDEKKQVDGIYKGQLVLLTNRRVLSAGENLVGASASVSDRIVIGENTGGVAQFSSTCAYVLPNSRLVLNLPRQLIFIPGLEECVGYLPDYWLDTHLPLEETLKWLESPEKYQFHYTETYEELVERLGLSTLLPEDVHIHQPDPDIPDSLAVFSGKWFGVSDGVLDHMLVVENISVSGEVNAIYAWGVAHQWGVNPGYERFKGIFQNGKLVLQDKDRNLIITYEIRPDGSMDSWYKRPGINSYTEMVKLADE